MEGAEGGEGVEGEADDLGEEAGDVFGGVGAVGVQADGAAGVSGELVLIDDSFEGAAVAGAVVEVVGRKAGEGEGRVDDDLRLLCGA